MNTVFLLMAQYEKATIPLEDFCEEYLSFSIDTAKRKHNAGELGLPLFRFGDSQKSALCVRVQDLAEYIDNKASAARQLVSQCAI